MELGERVEVSLDGRWHDATIENQSGKHYGVRVDGYKELMAYGDPEQIPGAGEFLRPIPKVRLKNISHTACARGECSHGFDKATCMGSWDHGPHDWVYTQDWGGIRNFDYHCDGKPDPEGHSSAGCGHDHQTAEEITEAWVAGELNTLSSPPAASSAEERVVSSTGGEKGKKKDRYDLIPAEALRKVAELYGVAPAIGKYEDRNWERGYDWSLSFAALQRHIWQFWGGEDKDEETGMEHVACAIFHALALLTFMEEHPEFDDRPSTLKNEKSPPASGNTH